jgi:hypothetical protein
MPYVNHAKDRREKTNSTDNKEAKAKQHAAGAANGKLKAAQSIPGQRGAELEREGWEDLVGPANAPPRPDIDGRL